MKNKSLSESFMNAFSGFISTFKAERNFKIHVLVALCAVLAAFLLKIDTLSFAVVILSISAVLTAELINTAIEAVIDLYCGQELNPFAKTAKDTAAAAVLLSSFFAVIIGVAVFGNRIMELFISIPRV